MMAQPSAYTHIAVLFGAVLIDAVIGEVPARVHPVVGIGKLTSVLLAYRPRIGVQAQLGFGAILVGVVVGVSGAIAWGASHYARGPWGQALEALLLSTLFAGRGLVGAGKRMRRALSQSLARGRCALSHLCSRRADELSQTELAGATVESLAENTSDSFVAPLFWYVVCVWCGLPGLFGAAVYRAINTLDAMVGYRGEYEYVGKPAAILDDCLNWIPARLTAALLVLASGVAARRAWRTSFRDHALTASPNAGWPMAAASGALGVRLTKPGQYVLGFEYPDPNLEHIASSERLIMLCMGLSTLVFGAALLWSGGP